MWIQLLADFHANTINREGDKWDTRRLERITTTWSNQDAAAQSLGTIYMNRYLSKKRTNTKDMSELESIMNKMT